MLAEVLLLSKIQFKYLENLFLNNDLVDIWRVRYPDRKRFTWRQKKTLIQRRLDYWFVSDSLQDDIDKVDMFTSIKTDHSAITLDLKSITENKHGPSFWKFNNSLLDDQNYINTINENIPQWIEEVVNENDIRICWDWLKYKIRYETMRYSKKKARERKEKLCVLEKKLKQAEEKCALSPSQEVVEELQLLKEKYEADYDYIIQGAIIRSRATWYEQGEKNTKFFLNLENRREKKNVIRKLIINNNNNEISTDPKILQESLRSFYEDLYKEKNLQNDTILSSDPFVTSPNLPKLSDSQQTSCEGALTVSECYNTLKSFQSNKTPGNDGLTVEFYRTFWPRIGKLLVECLNYCHENGELSTSQKQAVITLIEKKDKDRRLIKNWRPISLINVDVKIASKTIAKRLEKVLPQIIHYDQNAYVKGRTIFDAVRTIDDIMTFTKSSNIDALLTAIDFEKAFDSISWAFLRKTLESFNFGKSLIMWVETFYKNISSCITNNGFASHFFQLSRGVRQGDPLSPYLFILVLETLANFIRYENKIKGIKINNYEIKLVTFADDLTVFLRDIPSFYLLLATLKTFSISSGLKVNKDKTEVLCLGQQNVITAKDINMDQIKSEVKILGLFFTYDQLSQNKLNFDSIIKSLKTSLNLWKWRSLTLLG